MPIVKTDYTPPIDNNKTGDVTYIKLKIKIFKIKNMGFYINIGSKKNNT
jgi:hypothetical protein